MLALEGEDVNMAHEEVFGYRPSSAAAYAAEPELAVRRPRPPTAPPPSRARPPRHPPQRRGGGLAPHQPPQGLLGQQLMRMTYTPTAVRKAPRRRIIIGGKAALSPPAPGAASTNGSATSALREEYYGEGAAAQDTLEAVSQPLAHGYSSPIRPSSATASGLSAPVTSLTETYDTVTPTEPEPTAKPVNTEAVGATASTPRTNPYYYTFQTPAEPTDGGDDVADDEEAQDDSPVPHSKANHHASAYHSPQSAGCRGNGGVAGGGPLILTTPPASPQPHLTASPSQYPGSATDTSVFERLTGASMVGMSMLSRRVHQWAEGAGIVLRAPGEAWGALCAYSLDPLRHERRWRQVCAKGRHRLGLLARAKACGSSAGAGGGGGGESANGSREHSSSHLASHTDPHHEATGEGPHNRGRAGGRHALPSATPGGLAAYRRHQEYKRWCHWQLWRFFEQGNAYLTSVWRTAPTVGGCGGGGAGSGSATSTSAAPLSLIFDGCYAVPCAANIEEAQSTYKAQVRQAKTLLRLLLEEHGTTSAAASTSGLGQSAAGKSHRSAASDGEAEDENQEDEEDVNVYHSINESRRTSEAVAATEPYVKVRVDAMTGLMHMSLYVNGDAGGSEAAFAGSCVAGCLDNHRWLVLNGLWAKQVIFFCFRRTSANCSSSSAAGSAAAGDLFTEGKPHSSTTEYNAEAENYFSRRSQVVDGFVVKGVAFAKAPGEQSATAAQDSVACMRCGHTRYRHSEAYVSRETGRMMRGVYYCVVCRKRTHHVRLPTAGTMPAAFASGGLERSTLNAAGEGDATPVPSVRDASHRSATASTRGAGSPRSGLLPSARSATHSAAHIDISLLDTEVAAVAMREWTRASAAAPRPAWNSVAKANSEALFGRPPLLDRPPPWPRRK